MDNLFPQPVTKFLELARNIFGKRFRGKLWALMVTKTNDTDEWTAKRTNKKRTDRTTDRDRRGERKTGRQTDGRTNADREEGGAA